MVVWLATKTIAEPMLWRKTLQLIFCLGLFLPQYGMADDADAWLMKISKAVRHTNYQGVFVYQHGNYLEAMQIVHRVDQDGVKERLVSLNGAPREVIRNNEEVRCYLPDENYVVVEHRKANDKSFPSILPERIRILDNNYEISLGRKGRVTDTEAQQVIISPRDRYRYGYELWAAKDSGLLLEADLINNAGEPIERFMFTQITVGGVIHASALQPRTESRDLVWHHNPEAAASNSPESRWQIGSLPKGFNLSAHMSRTMPQKTAPTEHLVFSDGLAAVSVFIEPLGASEGITGASQMGAVHAFSTVMDKHQITVVGEVPAETVALIGNSVRLKRE